MTNYFSITEIILFFAWLVQFIAWWKLNKTSRNMAKWLVVGMKVLEEHELVNEFLEKLKDYINE